MFLHGLIYCNAITHEVCLLKVFILKGVQLTLFYFWFIRYRFRVAYWKAIPCGWTKWGSAKAATRVHRYVFLSQGPIWYLLEASNYPSNIINKKFLVLSASSSHILGGVEVLLGVSTSQCYSRQVADNVLGICAWCSGNRFWEFVAIISFASPFLKLKQ